MPRRNPPILHDVPFFEVGGDADDAGHAPDPADANPEPILGAAPAAGIRLAGPVPKRGRGRPRKDAAPQGLLLAAPVAADAAPADDVGIVLDNLAADDGDDAPVDGAISRYVNLSQLARLTGKSRNTIRQWIASGMPIHRRAAADEGTGHQFDIAAIIAWREERARAAAGCDADELMDKEEAQRRKLAAEASMAEFNLARVRQETLLLGDVLHIVTSEYSEVRARLRSLPARLSQILAGSDAETLFRELRKEIDVVLNSLSYDAAVERQIDEQQRGNRAAAPGPAGVDPDAADDGEA